MKTSKILKERGIYENPYKKYERLGAEGLSDAELLAVMLRTGSRDMDALELAGAILTGCENNLLNLTALNEFELRALPGIGPVKAMELRCIFEISKRISKENRRYRLYFKDSRSIAMYFMEEMRHLKEEVLCAAFFDSKGRLSSEKVITRGNSFNTLIDPRQILKEAVLSEASFLVILHNHPSGDPSPSRDDRDSTAHLNECCNTLGIPLIDHLIIGDRVYYSFREHNDL